MAKRTWMSLLLLVILIFQSTISTPLTSTSESSRTITWQNDYSIVQYALPDNSSVPISIAVSPNGTVWVLEQAANKLVAFNPLNRRFTTYPIPTSNSFPLSVAVDKSGNVWFTELNGEKLGYLDPTSGNIAEYPIPGINVSVYGLSQRIPCGPAAIAFDKADNVWLACLFSNQIDEFISAEHEFVSFNLPVFQSGPSALLVTDSGLWFSAADANMLGYADFNALVPNSSAGITEFSPLNKSYLYTFSHPTSFLGGYENLTSSLPTPTSIASSSNGSVLWITEHVDNSFDSYNVQTKVLDKFWLSKTNGTFGYAYAFPNYIHPDASGNLWIAEHYGNKIAIFSPSQMSLIELKVPCCSSDIAGAYTGALDWQGNFWFVESNAAAIGEVIKGNSSSVLTAQVSTTNIAIHYGGYVSVPITYSLQSGKSLNLLFDVSGITPDGNLQNITAQFNQSRIQIVAGKEASLQLTFHDTGLKPGRYYLTVSAISSNAVYSFIMSMQAEGMQTLSLSSSVLLSAALTLISVSLVYIAIRLHRRRMV
ncbi:MAG: hypothetical protein QXX17_03785 [Conexivisphaerales archaeon]